ncbi:MAG: hypothetical protein GWN02_05765 [Gemmatimonadetes bacterium]|nr:hypothetical protein [Gemmatimonadota bacterium]
MSNLRAVPMIASALLLSALVACDSPTGPDPELRVVDLTLEAVGDAGRLQARLDGAEVEPTWESLDATIVSVTAAGQATAVAPGTATVRARLGDRTAEGTVTVLPPVDVRLSELAVVTDPSGNRGMRMRIRNLGGRGYYRLEFWRIGADGRHERFLHYASDAEAPVGLDIIHANYLSDETADWVLAYSREPLSQEPVRTSCVRLDGQPTCPPDPPQEPGPQEPAAVDSVFVSPGAAVLQIGQAIQYTARVFAGGVEVMDRPVAWSTPSPNVISLTPGGVALALASGYGEVHATAGGVTGAVGLTVMTPEPEPEPVGNVVILTGWPIRLWVGQTRPLHAVVLNSQGLPLEGRTVTWAVANPTIARVDTAGVIAGVGHGTTVVSATSGGKTGYASARSFARPVDRAGFVFAGTLSDTSTSQIATSVDTTWVDEHGVEHPAYITFGAGHLGLDWSGATSSYEQRLTLTTYITENYMVKKVAETEYVDTGTVAVLYDLFTGDHIYELRSTVTPGLVYLGRYSLPGELAVTQPIGGIAAQKYYFDLE